MNADTGDPVWRADSPAERVAILAALEIEAAIPRRLLGGANPIYVSGPGDRRAYATAQRALGDGATALIALGFAGGLAPEARTACIVLPRSVIGTGGEWPTAAEWRQALADVLGRDFALLDGALYSAEQVVTTPADKSALAARSGAVAVDMESAAAARAATEAGVPFIVLRVIADSAGDQLPQNVELLVTDAGRTNYAKLPMFIFSLSRLPALFRLARRSGAARRELGRVMQVLKGARAR